MKTTHLSSHLLQQRKFLIVLPLLVFPFLTLLFWSLGGGKTDTTQAEADAFGFNMQLPEPALLASSTLDKMSYYNQAQMDSVQRLKQMQNDPYYKPDSNSHMTVTTSELLSPSIQGSFKQQALKTNTSTSSSEAKVYDKINQLNAVLAKDASTPMTDGKEYQNNVSPNPALSPAVTNTADMERLEKMMQTVSQPTEEDPEMTQINEMLEKILDIQHPERMQEKIRQVSEQKTNQVFAVSASMDTNPVSLLSGVVPNQQVTCRSNNGFYALNPDPLTEQPTASATLSGAIEAVMAQSQQLTNGSTVKLRITHPIYINGICIPKDQYLYGIASLNGERLEVSIKSLRYQNILFPIELSVYDTDGLKGIYVPGAITRDVAKQSTNQMLQGINLNTMDISLGAQATSAGIEAAKNLLSRKAKLIRVTVKAGYRLFLHDEKQGQ
ncbi:conjugative transposon protein TraM [Cytophagaceae bacterium DM2B3-1]|uniref:Conjugative transposon protein TraM n=1 Tax=Xanthocytophaga flava TaxID=3048013 RepID=A0ABT7CL10_9BACT|nr:conjugative transposon protein TraM [Xanthocytophaga flavus]MDJ1493687.1 conjugative transposon protein TraM [Xanthocytophaga flavus]